MKSAVILFVLFLSAFHIVCAVNPFTAPLSWLRDILYGDHEERRLLLASRILAAVVNDPMSFASGPDTQLGGSPALENAEATSATKRSTATTLTRRRRTIFNGHVEKSLRLVRLNDVNDCISLMVCSAARVPRSYGSFGVKINRFFRYPTWDSGSAGSYYAKIARMGRKSGSCRTRFTRCRRPMKPLFTSRTRVTLRGR
ncbi:uncharacterized protein LOC135397221 [Ornithodoros turicata]|uniref:uncharacterized protein LOC135397221 n=1 Tax=Ornithodoros turicata TaxID=34597 RepID=UPI0031398468